MRSYGPVVLPKKRGKGVTWSQEKFSCDHATILSTFWSDQKKNRDHRDQVRKGPTWVVLEFALELIHPETQAILQLLLEKPQMNHWSLFDSLNNRCANSTDHEICMRILLSKDIPCRPHRITLLTYALTKGTCTEITLVLDEFAHRQHLLPCFMDLANATQRIHLLNLGLIEREEPQMKDSTDLSELESQTMKFKRDKHTTWQTLATFLPDELGLIILLYLNYLD